VRACVRVFQQGKLRPNERVEWEAFLDMLNGPATAAAAAPPQQGWQARMAQMAAMQQAPPPPQMPGYYGQVLGGYEGADYGYDDPAYAAAEPQPLAQYPRRARQPQQSRQQPYAEGEDEYMDAEGEEAGADGAGADDGGTWRGGKAAADAASALFAAAAAAAGTSARPGSRSGTWRGRQHLSAAAAAAAAADAATDSQEDEAAAYPHKQDAPGGEAAAALAAAAAAGDRGAAGSPTDSFLHLLAVGEAMFKTEGVAPHDSQAAYTEARCVAWWCAAGSHQLHAAGWAFRTQRLQHTAQLTRLRCGCCVLTQVVERQLPPQEQDRGATRAADSSQQGVKRSRFALEAEEQQVGWVRAGGKRACGRPPLPLRASTHVSWS
jgi:hypothetical protein